MMKVNFVKTCPEAVTPTRAHNSDIGWDLTCIKEHKRLSDNTVMFDTGIQVRPPQGCYIEIVPRSSLTKSGYIMANSIAVIDPSYRGNILIAVRKVDSQLPDLEVPFCRFQMILRTVVDCKFDEVKNLDETERGSGGFGSTD